MKQTFITIVIPNANHDINDEFVEKIKKDIESAHKKLSDERLEIIQRIFEKEIVEYKNSKSRPKKQSAVVDRINIILNQTCKHFALQDVVSIEDSWMVQLLKESSIEYDLYESDGKNKKLVVMELE